MANHGRSSLPTAAAADDEGNGRPRRFPNPPPSQPHGHGVDAALLTRRQELLLEMHKGFMHQGMFWRELMETERAMGLTVGGYNCNHVSAISYPWTPSVPSWEAPLRQPYPCGSGSSPAVRVPPLYQHVERSLQVPEQTRPVNDAMQHQEGTPSRPTTEGTSAGVKRKLTPPSSPVKKQQTRPRQDVEEDVPENRWTCTLCQVKCTSELDYHNHVGGRRHRGNQEASRTRPLYCETCDVQCTSEKMLEEHLGRRKHREMLEGSHSD